MSVEGAPTENDVDGTGGAARGPEHLGFVGGSQPVAALDLDRRHPVRQHLLEARARELDQLVLGGGAGRRDRGVDPAAGLWFPEMALELVHNADPGF